MAQLALVHSAATDGAEDCILDLSALLAPVSEAAPTGCDLRADAAVGSIYYVLRDARTSARNRERAALADGDADYIDRGDWAPILEQVPQALISESKDLELVAWLIEALVRCHGFRGARVGFRLARELIERYGQELHPRPDEDGLPAQLAALTGLNGFGSEGALISPLKSVPLTAGSPPAPFSAWQCEQAFELERIPNPAKREARNKRGFVTRAAVDQAVAETTPEFFTALHRELTAAIAEFDRYQAAMDAYCGDEPQPTARIKETLGSCLQTLSYIAGAKILPDAPPAADAPAANDDGAPKPAPGVISDRDAALRSLREIANFFRRTEPHSPISYAIEQAVYWSQLSLPDLIGELIPDENARQKYRTLTGIRAQDRA